MFKIYVETTVDESLMISDWLISRNARVSPVYLGMNKEMWQMDSETATAFILSPFSRFRIEFEPE